MKVKAQLVTLIQKVYLVGQVKFNQHTARVVLTSWQVKSDLVGDFADQGGSQIAVAFLYWHTFVVVGILHDLSFVKLSSKSDQEPGNC